MAHDAGRAAGGGARCKVSKWFAQEMCSSIYVKYLRTVQGGRGAGARTGRDQKTHNRRGRGGAGSGQVGGDGVRTVQFKLATTLLYRKAVARRTLGLAAGSGEHGGETTRTSFDKKINNTRSCACAMCV